MQNASTNFSQAASGATRVLADPLFVADWGQDGYSSPVVVDSFTRSVSNGWGATDTATPPITNSYSWSIIAGLSTAFAVNGLAGTMAIPTANNAHQANLSGSSFLDSNQVATTTCPVPTGGSIEAITLVARWLDAVNYYHFRAVVDTSAAITVQLVKGVAATETLLTSAVVPRLVHTATTPLRMRAKVTGNRFQARVWRTTRAEPQTWQIDYTDTAIMVAGQLGIRTAVYSGNTNTKPVTFTIDSYQVNSGYDDLSRQLGSWSVRHHLDDGLPDEVSFVAGVGTAELTASVGGRYVPGVGPMSAVNYWSPVRADSPVYGIERDIAPLKLEVGFVTVGGQERVPIFTGQMADTPISPNNAAKVEGMSATRLKLAKLIQPPGIRASWAGANATWPISYALAKCGVYPSPPPRTGVRWWAPMHGSLTAFYPDDFHVQAPYPATDESALGYSGANSSQFLIPEWVDGPFVLGCDVGLATNKHRQVAITGVRLGTGTDLLSKAGSAGRFECWVKGDAANTNLAPAGSGQVTKLSGIELNGTNSNWYARMGVGTDRKVFVTVNDGAGHIVTLKSTDTLPTDGQWYFVGAAYDVANKKLWCTNFNGTTAATGVASFVTSSLPNNDTWVDRAGSSNQAPVWVAWIPTAEVHLTAGLQANVDSYPAWLNTISWSQGALITPSPIELVGLAEPVPREAWEFIGSFAQAEPAMLRTDEQDRVLYLGPGWFVRDAQQTATPMIATDWNAASLTVVRDLSKIRNAVRVTYQFAEETPTLRNVVYSNNNPVALDPGLTTVTVAFGSPAMELTGNDIEMLTDVDLANPYYFVPGSITNYVTINLAADGTGLYNVDPARFDIQMESWHPGGAVINIRNMTAVTWYLANNANKPSLALDGWALAVRSASETEADVASVALRGERGLAIDRPRLQRAVDARRLARRLKMALRAPVNVVQGVSVVGDPRRQPGDLVAVVDRETGAAGDWRIQTIDHNGDRAKYTQSVTVRRTLPICVVGRGLVGGSLVGPGS